MQLLTYAMASGYAQPAVANGLADPVIFEDASDELGMIDGVGSTINMAQQLVGTTVRVRAAVTMVGAGSGEFRGQLMVNGQIVDQMAAALGSPAMLSANIHVASNSAIQLVAVNDSGAEAQIAPMSMLIIED